MVLSFSATVLVNQSLSLLISVFASMMGCAELSRAEGSCMVVARSPGRSGFAILREGREWGGLYVFVFVEFEFEDECEFVEDEIGSKIDCKVVVLEQGLVSE